MDRIARWMVALAALLSHAPSLQAGFVWLDHAHLEDGLALAQTSSWSALFAHGFAGTGYYRPLMSVSLSLDAALGGSAFVYHATTLLWHMAAAVMVAVAAEQLGLSRRAANGAGLLFAVHPLTSVVASAIAFRSEAMILVALLGLITLHLLGKSWASGAVLCAGALCKETALVLGPLFVIALELSVRPLPTPAKRWRLWGAEALGLLGALTLRGSFAPGWRAGHVPLSLDEALGTRLASVTKGARALLVPLDNGVCDAFEVARSGTPVAAAGLVVLALVAYLAWRRRGPALLLALALIPSLQLVPVMRWWSPHYFYLPLAFVAMLAVEAIERYREPALRWLPPLALALAGLSWLDARRYASDQTLWEKELRLQPACREAHFYLGEVALAAKHWERATQHYSLAIAPTPGVLSYVDLPAALQNLGASHLQQGHFASAAAAFERALQVSSNATTRQQLQHNLLLAGSLARAQQGRK